MSDSYESKADVATVLAMHARSKDERIVLSQVTRAPRAATRYRASSVRRSFVPPRQVPQRTQHEYNLAMDGMGGHVSSSTRQVVVRGSANGQRLTDFHRK